MPLEKKGHVDDSICCSKTYVPVSINGAFTSPCKSPMPCALTQPHTVTDAVNTMSLWNGVVPFLFNCIFLYCNNLLYLIEMSTSFHLTSL